MESYNNERAVYILGKHVGEGNCGAVRMVTDVSSNRLLVCKSLKKTPIQQPICHKDTALTMSCRGADEVLKMVHVIGHPSVVQFVDFVEDSKWLHIIMEYCREGDLFDHISSRVCLSEVESAHVIKQIASALHHCHSRGLIHRDVKPENILISKFETCPKSLKETPVVKLADFGNAEILPNGFKARGLTGTLKYAAPEIFLSEGYSSEVDIWSLGVVLYIALVGRFPFYGSCKEDVILSICYKNLFFDECKRSPISQDAIDLLTSMLQKDPKLRPTALEVLNHGWIKRLTEAELKISHPTVYSPVARAVSNEMTIFSVSTRNSLPFDISHIEATMVTKSTSKRKAKIKSSDRFSLNWFPY